MKIKALDSANLRPQFPIPAEAKGPSDLKRREHVEVNFEVRESSDESGLNKMEKDWLAVLRSRGYLKIRVQAVTLKLGHDTRYTPDFSAIVNRRQVFFETKGYMRDDARVKLYNAAREFSEYDFVKVTRENGSWKEQEVKP